MPQKNTMDEEITIDLLKILKAFWKKAWLILLVGVLFSSAMFVYEKSTYVPSYQASVTMYAKVNTQNNTPSNNIDTLIGTCIAVSKTRMTLEKVSDTTGLNIPCSELSNMISAAQITKSSLFRITVTTANPEEAAQIANAVGDILPDMIAFAYDAHSEVGVVDYALIPAAPVSNYTAKNAVIAGILGMMLVCCVIAVQIIYLEIKESKDKKQVQ